MKAKVSSLEIDRIRYAQTCSVMESTVRCIELKEKYGMQSHWMLPLRSGWDAFVLLRKWTAPFYPSQSGGAVQLLQYRTTIKNCCKDTSETKTLSWWIQLTSIDTHYSKIARRIGHADDGFAKILVGATLGAESSLGHSRLSFVGLGVPSWFLLSFSAVVTLYLMS